MSYSLPINVDCHTLTEIISSVTAILVQSLGNFNYNVTRKDVNNVLNFHPIILKLII